MVALLGMAALAVDLAMGFAARAEAQRVADSAALAGGSAYLELEPNAAAPLSEARALEYALRNSVRGEAVEASQVQIVTIPAERRIRVRVEKTDLPTWFGRILGFDFIPVAATAAAEVTEAGIARCLKPFAVPDLWNETNKEEQDSIVADNIWEEEEPWVFDEGDNYLEHTAASGDDASETGYGSTLRGQDRDYGRDITIKASDPQSDQALNPGLFYPWRLPTDPVQAECQTGGGGGGSTGGAVYRRNICSCNNSPIELGVPYDLEPGNMIGPTNQGVGELFDLDPYATWAEGVPVGDGRFGKIQGSAFADPMDSPRVMKIALFDIRQIDKPGMQSIEFNNFALMFLMNKPNGQEPVKAKFLWWAEGSDLGPGPTTGSLVLFLRLVE
jgi:hypothetical protein